MKQNFEVFVFDFDGTLVQSNDIKDNIFIEVASEFHSDSTLIKEILSDDVHNTRFEIFEKFFLTIFPHNDISNILKKSLDKFTILCEEAVISVPEVKGALKTIKILKNLNKRLFISSLTPEDTLKKIVTERKMDIYFEHIFGSPDTKINHLKKIQGITNLNPSQTVYIGDSNSDMVASMEFGCSYIGIGEDESIYNSKPTYFLENYNCFFEKI